MNESTVKLCTGIKLDILQTTFICTITRKSNKFDHNYFMRPLKPTNPLELLKHNVIFINLSCDRRVYV